MGGVLRCTKPIVVAKHLTRSTAQPTAATFTSLSGATFEDFLKTQATLDKVSAPDAMANRWLSLLNSQDVEMGFPVTLLEHNLQTATRDHPTTSFNIWQYFKNSLENLHIFFKA